MNYLGQAIQMLRPNSEFSFTNDDYSTIKWDVLEGEAPTQAEINAAIEKIKSDEIAKAEAEITAKVALAAAKQAAQEKLKALGLNDLEIAAITGA